ncbi:MAG TPA: ATP-binding protein [Burkholderiales bacterium]|nr:ATP-binding protein [Burkholderiales bacterium]
MRVASGGLAQWPRRMRSEIAIASLALVVIVAGGALTAREVYVDRHTTLAEGERMLNLAVAALEKHTVETFAQATSSMASVDKMVARAGGLDRVSPETAHEWLKALTPTSSPLDRLVLFNARGIIVATTVRPHPPKPEAFVDDPAIAPHIKGAYGDRLFIGLPMELPAETIIRGPMNNPGSSRWVIPVTRALRKTDGGTDAIVAALFRVDYFKEFYGILGNHRDASIALLREDNVLLARHPFRPEHLGLNATAIMIRFKDLVGRDGLPIMHSPLDQIERIYAARRLQNLPLTVVVGLSTKQLLSGWRERVVQRTAAFCIFAFVVIAMTALLARHIASRRKAEADLEDLNQELEHRVRVRTTELAQANEDLQAFNYSASHDLRAPIRRIRSFSEAIHSEHGDSLPDDAKRMLSRIHHSARQMDGLLSDVLSLFKTNQAPMRPASIDLGDLIRAIVAEIAADDPHRSYELRMNTEDMRVCADAGQMRLALTNLISNAWKYSTQTDATKIEVGRIQDTFYIRDNGVGFDLQHAERLFAPFSRLHTDAEFEGNGIGLAIVKRVIERHGGRIYAESSPGKGATFYFTLGTVEEVERRAGHA